MATLDLNNFELEPRQHSVIYAGADVIIYRDRMLLIASDCSGKMISTIRCPLEWRNHKMIELEFGKVLCLFGGKDFVLWNGTLFETHTLDYRMGRCVSDLFKYGDSVVFATRYNGQIQVVIYDYVNKTRSFQSASHSLLSVSDMIVNGDLAYVLHDNTFLICFDLKTGDIVWCRFEAGKIDGICLFQNKVSYSVGGMLKIPNIKDNQAVRIPMVKINSIEHTRNDLFYLLFGDNKKICCYNDSTKKVEWEITSKLPILETLTVRSKQKTNVYDVMLVKTENYLSMINLNLGQSFYHSKLDGIHSFYETEKYIIVQKYSKGSVLIKGI